MERTTPQALERQLRDDLRSLGDRLADDRLVGDLYRALTRTRWHRFDRDGEVALSFSHAEGLLNALRAERGLEPLPLERSGGEGEIAGRLDGLLGELGWTIEPLDTGGHDEAHLGASGAGEPHTEPQETLAEGHREADERPPVPKQGTPGR